MSVQVLSLCVHPGSLTMMGNYAGQLGQLKPDEGRVCTDTSFPWFPWRVWLILVCWTTRVSVGPFCKWKCLLHIQRNRSVFHMLWLRCQWKCLIHFQMLLWNWQLNGETDMVTVLSPDSKQLHQHWYNVSRVGQKRNTTIEKKYDHLKE